MVSNCAKFEEVMLMLMYSCASEHGHGHAHKIKPRLFMLEQSCVNMQMCCMFQYIWPATHGLRMMQKTRALLLIKGAK